MGEVAHPFIHTVLRVRIVCLRAYDNFRAFMCVCLLVGASMKIGVCHCVRTRVFAPLARLPEVAVVTWIIRVGFSVLCTHSAACNIRCVKVFCKIFFPNYSNEKIKCKVNITSVLSEELNPPETRSSSVRPDNTLN